MGEIEYVLTDKTGTLTQNKMILRGLCIGDKLFGGEFGYNENQDKEFKLKKRDKFDNELHKILSGENQERLPYEMDIAKHKIKQGGVKEKFDPDKNYYEKRKSTYPLGLFSKSNISEKSKSMKKELKFLDSKRGATGNPSMEEFHTDNLEYIDFDRPEDQEPISLKKALTLQREKSFSFIPPKERTFPPNLKNGTQFKTYHQLSKEFALCAALCHEILVEEDEETKERKYQGSSPDEIAICAGAKKIGSEFRGNSLGISKVNFLGEELEFEVKMVKIK